MVTILRVYLFISFVFLRKVPNEEDLRQWPEVTQFQAYGSPEKLERLESFQFLSVFMFRQPLRDKMFYFLLKF